MAEWTYTRITPKTDEADGKYYGIVDTLPTRNLIRGDSCTAREDGALVIKAWNGYRWVPLADSNLSNAEQSVICAKAQKDVLEAVETGTVTTSEYGYFRTLIAGVVSADYIKALEGVFENIVVTGESYFYGKFNCPTIESMPNTSSGVSVSATIPGSDTADIQFETLYSLLVENGIPIPGTYPCTSSYYSDIATFTISGISPIYIDFYRKDGSKVGYMRKQRPYIGPGYVYDSSLRYSQTITITYGMGDILKIKNVQSTAAGLQADQIYYTVMNGHKVLCLV